MGYKLKSTLQVASLYSLEQIFTKASAVFTYFLTPREFGIIGYIQVLVQLFYSVLIFGFYGAQTIYYYENSQQIDSFLFTIIPLESH